MLLRLQISYSTITNQYDDDGQLANQTQAPADGPSVTLTYGRNADELVNSVSTGSPYQYAVQYTYTGRNQLQQIQDGSGNPIATYGYDLAGNRLIRETMAYSGNKGFSASTVYTYDQCNRLSTETEQFGSGLGGDPNPTFGYVQYDYDKVGRIVDALHNGGNDNRNYYYDGFDNLNKIEIGPTSPPASTTIQLQIDPAGNRVSTQVANYGNENPAINYATNNLNQYAAVGSLDPTYDQEHNRTSYTVQISFTSPPRRI